MISLYEELVETATHESKIAWDKMHSSPLDRVQDRSDSFFFI